jgi:hypothetical protein
MEILITGGALGALLGRYFKVLILIPASVLIIALLLTKASFAGYPLLVSCVKIALLIVSLELGYLTGLLSAGVFATMRGIWGYWTR